MALRAPRMATASNPSQTAQVEDDSLLNDADPYLDTAADEPEVETAGTDLISSDPASAPLTAFDREVGNDSSFDSLDDDVGYGSFPMVKLDKDTLVTSDGDEFKSLDAVLIRMSRKTLVKARPGQDDDIPFFYTYNNTTALDGRSVSDYLREWRESGEMEDGAEPVKSEYLEVLGEVHGTGTDLDGEFVIFNVAPASRRKLAGYKMKLQARGLALNKVLTRVAAGAKVTKGKNTFHPWDFKLVGKVG